MKKIVLSLFLAFIYLCPIKSQSTSDISGAWQLTTQTKSSSQDQKILISKKNDHFKGTYDNVEFDIYLDNDNITWMIEQSSSNGTITIEAKGAKINNQLYMGLTTAKANFLELDEMKWSLERVE